MAGYILPLFLVSSLFQGILSVNVMVNHRELIVKEGDPIEMLCHVNSPIEFCRMEIPHEGSLSFSPTKKQPGMSYIGEGLDKGDCGVRILSAKEIHNGEFRCAMFTSDSSKEVVGLMNLTIAKTPNRPELRISPQSESYKEGETLLATCSVRNGRPAANISWYIGDEKITDGLGQPMMIDFKPTDLYSIEQNLTRRIQATDNGKALKCVAQHPLLNDKQNTSMKIIYVKFPPKETSQPLERFGLVEGEEGRIIVTVQANPQPAFTWVVGEESIHEGDSDSSGRVRSLPGIATPNMGQGSWDSVLLIDQLAKEDVEKNYQLVAKNALGEQTYKVIISTSPEPRMMELGAGAIVGIVVAVLLLLTIAAVFLFARAKGRWCFAGQNSQFAGESSDTESAVHNSNPRIRKTPFFAVFKKKRDKVSSEDVSEPKDSQEEGKDEDNNESARVILNPSKPDEGVVYAELDLNLQPGARPPTVRPPEDKTEYAEIIHSKDSS